MKPEVEVDYEDEYDLGVSVEVVDEVVEEFAFFKDNQIVHDGKLDEFEREEVPFLEYNLIFHDGQLKKFEKEDDEGFVKEIWKDVEPLQNDIQAPLNTPSFGAPL